MSEPEPSLIIVVDRNFGPSKLWLLTVILNHLKLWVWDINLTVQNYITLDLFFSFFGSILLHHLFYTTDTIPHDLGTAK